ncbi:MAG: glycosyltransferase, partial [Candidatus Aminicenantes bacterium]|nr:glycosyltransferase [Candidatus Aminicenantes bacterium]
MKFSAVIVTYNNEKVILPCLESLQGVADEIVVVDSASTDQTRKIA